MLMHEHVNARILQHKLDSLENFGTSHMLRPKFALGILCPSSTAATKGHCQKRTTIPSSKLINIALVQKLCTLVNSLHKSPLPLLQDRPLQLGGRKQMHVAHTKISHLR